MFKQLDFLHQSKICSDESFEEINFKWVDSDSDEVDSSSEEDSDSKKDLDSDEENYSYEDYSDSNENYYSCEEDLYSSKDLDSDENDDMKARTQGDEEEAIRS
ncbi:hypothetical protein RJ641_035975 [Dillenia turbinata]|uniref:Uncharacterized protein n=1 Tax=Dillenia turbinata TaxID=194707 RepID=A0AAN8VNC1_9MAGN